MVTPQKHLPASGWRGCHGGRVESQCIQCVQQPRTEGRSQLFNALYLYALRLELAIYCSVTLLAMGCCAGCLLCKEQAVRLRNEELSARFACWQARQRRECGPEELAMAAACGAGAARKGCSSGGAIGCLRRAVAEPPSCRQAAAPNHHAVPHTLGRSARRILFSPRSAWGDVLLSHAVC